MTASAADGRRTRGRRRRWGAALAVVAVLALGGGLTACSSSSSSTTTTNASTGTPADAAALSASSYTAMKALASFRVSGSIVTSGQNMTVDMVLTHDGFQGTFTTSKGTFQIVTLGNTVYMEADHAFWTTEGMPDATAQLVAGKWLTGLPQSATKGLVNAFTINQLFGSLKSTGKVTEMGTSTIGGQSVVALKGSDGSIGYIAATGTPYLVKVVSPDKGAQGTVTFSELGTAPVPTAPAGAVDFSSLAG